MFRGDKYTTPLYRVEDVRSPKQGASAVWLRIAEAHFLVTAAHAMDEGFIWFPMDRGVKRIESPGVISNAPAGQRERDHVDLAIFRLVSDDLTARHRFFEDVTMDMIEVSLRYQPKRVFEFTGYPYRRVEIDFEERSLDPGYMSITSDLATEKHFKKLGLSVETHIVVGYSRRKTFRQGVRYHAPLPHGMSGGAVWTRERDSEVRRLAAIGIECPHNNLVAVRIAAALEMIRSKWPDVSSAIPAPDDILIEAQC